MRFNSLRRKCFRLFLERTVPRNGTDPMATISTVRIVGLGHRNQNLMADG